ncbi:MAG: hypothetical protein IKS18_02680 [Lachnospiraceae bacterium]|nr:hypothetical protein [Lachnospiraceae bacterium]
MAKQIKSRERVAEHGEVFTAEREVNAMLDLVKNETERIESRFLEPACGNGNFLAEILRRKLAVVKKKYGKSKAEYEKYSVLAVSSVYGVDLLDDNVRECQDRLYEIWQGEYAAVCKDAVMPDCEEAVRFILKHNILCGNALTMMRVDPEGNDTDQPIIFAQWDLMTGDLMKRRDYRLDELMRGHNEQMDLQMYLGGWEYDEETHAWIPAPIQEFEPINYWEVQNGINL